MLRWWMLACALALTVMCGCAPQDPDNVLDVVHDACEPIGVVVTEPMVATSAQAQGITDAMALWAAHGVGTMAMTSDMPATSTIEVRFEAAAEAFHGVYDDENGIIYINTKIREPHALSVTIAHELGHAMGLWHYDEEPSLMNKGNTRIEPTPGDKERLSAVWGDCASASSARSGW